MDQQLNGQFDSGEPTLVIQRWSERLTGAFAYRFPHFELPGGESLIPEDDNMLRLRAVPSGRIVTLQPTAFSETHRRAA